MEKISNKELDMLIDLHQDKYCENALDIAVQKASNELKYYKDLEEQGLLLKLPCKIGTIVYVIGTRCLAGEEPIKGCGCVPCEKCIYDKTYTIFEREVNNSLMYNLVMDSNDNYVLNKTVFLTKVAAERKLKEMEKENE